MKRSIIEILMVMFSFGLSFVSCGKKVPHDLEQAKDVLARFVAPASLQNSMFGAAYPECKPSQLVHYMFTSLAAAEMPIGEKMASEEDREQSAAIGMPLWPDSVAMTQLVPDPLKGKQLVLKYDDAKGLMIVEAYEDPWAEPVARYEWKIEKVAPSEMARLSFQSNLEAGAKY